MCADTEEELQDSFIVAPAVPAGAVMVILEPDAGKLGRVEFNAGSCPPWSAPQVPAHPSLFESVGEERQHVIARSEPPAIPLVESLDVKTVLPSPQRVDGSRRNPCSIKSLQVSVLQKIEVFALQDDALRCRRLPFPDGFHVEKSAVPSELRIIRNTGAFGFAEKDRRTEVKGGIADIK